MAKPHMASFAGHRGCVWEGDVLPGSRQRRKLLALLALQLSIFIDFPSVLSSIGNWTQMAMPCYIQLTPSFINIYPTAQDLSYSR